MILTPFLASFAAGGAVVYFVMDTVNAAITALPEPRKEYTFYAWFYKFANLELYNVKNLVASKFGNRPGAEEAPETPKE